MASWSKECVGNRHNLVWLPPERKPYSLRKVGTFCYWPENQSRVAVIQSLHELCPAQVVCWELGQHHTPPAPRTSMYPSTMYISPYICLCRGVVKVAPVHPGSIGKCTYNFLIYYERLIVEWSSSYIDDAYLGTVCLLEMKKNASAPQCRIAKRVTDPRFNGEHLLVRARAAVDCGPCSLFNWGQSEICRLPKRWRGVSKYCT